MPGRPPGLSNAPASTVEIVPQLDTDVMIQGKILVVHFFFFSKSLGIFNGYCLSDGVHRHGGALKGAAVGTLARYFINVLVPGQNQYNPIVF